MQRIKFFYTLLLLLLPITYVHGVYKYIDVYEYLDIDDYQGEKDIIHLHLKKMYILMLKI